ncbi:hypothetical protein IWW37_005685 [Coemansia sp. RSA 2050]|nr:hypothetical protein IWW37_005685 [Coemansia sp. RSA 2050]KAJ2729307.1 hypothetical protein IW152_005671 [Coemansia sp. BCRC 34962]
MLGIDHTTTTTTKEPKAGYRQSWSSDEPMSSSTSASSKESKSLWSKLRKQASRLNASSPSSRLGAFSTTAASSQTSIPHASRPRTAPSSPHSIVPSTLSSATATPPMRSTPNIAPEPSSRTWSSAIPSPRSQSSKRSPVAAAISAIDGSRVSADLFRSSGSGPNKPPVHSYSMDLPRSTTLPLARAHQSAAPEAFVAKPEVTRGMPRLRRLMLLPQSHSTGTRRPTSRDNSTDLPASALECIVEDDEVPHPVSAPVLSRPRADSGAIPLSRLPQPSHRHAHMPPAMPMSFNSDSVLQVYKHIDRKRFSENSGETTASLDTLAADSPSTELHRPTVRALATRSSSVRTPVAPPVVPRPLPRLSFSMGQRPTAIYENDSTMLPSPTRENPPKLVPMVHSQVSNADMLLDPTVYRNTFFNARPITEQQQIEATLVSRRPSTSNRLSTTSRSLYKSASDDTLNNGSSSKRESSSSSTKVRFSDHSDVIPDRTMDDKPLAALLPSALPQTQQKLVLVSPALNLSRRRLCRPSEAPTPLATATSMSAPVLEIDILRRTVRSLQAHNDLLSELVELDPLHAISEDTRLHIRTLELENIWLRKELERLNSPAATKRFL